MILNALILILICNSQKVTTEKTQDEQKFQAPQQQMRFQSCFEDLGCIETTEEWYHEVYRPRNLEPLKRHTIRTEFILISKDVKNSTAPLQYETLSLQKKSPNFPGYNKDANLVFLIHDFTSNGYTGWIKHISATLLHDREINVISVDWEAGAEPPFEQAIANARVVGLEVKALIKILKNSYLLNEESIYIIGHGVGAHIAGYVGTCFQIGKITGLDPTGPFFDKMPPIVRLDPSDAKYVDVLHTDSFSKRSQGTQLPMGHADFYLNGAKLQPNCVESTKYPIFTALNRDNIQEGTILPACSHKRSFKYYIEALENQNCEFTGIGCNSYEEFAKGKCTSCKNNLTTTNCATFGEVSVKEAHSARNFYVNTNGNSPYCLNTYRVKIQLENNSKAKRNQVGSFEILMIDADGILVNASAKYNGIPSSTHSFESGQSHTLIYYASPPRIINISEVRLKWIHNPNSLCVMFCNTKVYVDQVFIQLLSATDSNKFPESRLCPNLGKTEIENGSFIAFGKCEDKPNGGNTTATTTTTRQTPPCVETTTTPEKKCTSTTIATTQCMNTSLNQPTEQNSNSNPTSTSE